MSGLTEEQWTEVVKRLSIIDRIPGRIEKIENRIEDTSEKIEDTKISIGKIQVHIVKIDTSLFGVNRDNGIYSQVKKNTEAIEELKRIIPQKPDESTSKKIRGWIPVIICVLMSIASLYGWIESSITKNIQQTTVIQANPTP